MVDGGEVQQARWVSDRNVGSGSKVEKGGGRRRQRDGEERRRWRVKTQGKRV